MRKLFVIIFLFTTFTGFGQQYSPEETANLLEEYMLTIVADMQDWQLGKISKTQFIDNTRSNLRKIENVIEKSDISEARKRILKNEFEMYFNLLDGLLDDNN